MYNTEIVYKKIIEGESIRNTISEVAKIEEQESLKDSDMTSLLHWCKNFLKDCHSDPTFNIHKAYPNGSKEERKQTLYHEISDWLIELGPMCSYMSNKIKRYEEYKGA